MKNKAYSKLKTTRPVSLSTEYKSWLMMRNRCSNKRADQYRHYGGRGITVCERWEKFENFLADMGLKPSPNHSIDRIDNDGNYEPSNCRWAKQSEQRRNARDSVILKFCGEALNATDWSTKTGLSKSTISRRIISGWSVERTLTTPSRSLSRFNELNKP